jgi:site-specific recombinase XerD
MAFSVKLKINTQRIDANNYAALFFQVLIDSKKTTVKLDLRWSVQHFNEEKEEIFARNKKDNDLNDYQIIIQMKRSEINEIFKYYRLSNKPLDIPTFEAEILNAKSRTDFIQFFKNEINTRFDGGTIGKQTKKNNGSSLKMLERFKPSIAFRDISKKTVEDYQKFITRQTTPTGKHYRINTIAKFLSDFKAYLTYAKEASIIFDNPFENIKITTTEGSITFLKKNELLKIWDYYYSTNIKENHKIILRHFLFGCLTGLRHSDLERITWREIKQGNELEFEPYKTRKLQKTVNVPLCQPAKDLIETIKGNLFRVYVLQKSNSLLKEVAAICGIFKNLTTHVARHTFATQFLENGGQLQVLKELMGHTKIETTMIYVHVTNEHKHRQILLLDNIFISADKKKTPLENDSRGEYKSLKFALQNSRNVSQRSNSIRCNPCIMVN